MAHDRLHAILAHARRTAAPADGPLTDAQLLGRYLDGRDEAAFAALVRRHGGLVAAACRRALADEADVEDAFQATFLVLLRKAGTIRHRRTLASWLYRVAGRVAAAARVARDRRRTVERRPALPPVVAPPDLSWREVCEMLHGELDRLPTHLRLPLILCYLDGRTRDEAARQLGWPGSTLRGRLERGRAKLRMRLARRGVELSAALLATAAAARSDAAGSALVRAAVRLAGGASPPAAVAALAGAAVRVAVRVPVAVAGGLAVVAGLFAAVAVVGQRPAAPADTPAATPQAAHAVATAGPEIRGRVVGPDGNPVPGARLFVCDHGGRTPAPQPAADVSGLFRFSLVSEAGRVGPRSLLAMAPDRGADWVRLETATADVTLTLPPDVPIRGRVIDLEGRPVDGAVVRVAGLAATAPGKFDDYLRDLAEHNIGWRSSHLIDKFLYLGPAADPVKVPWAMANADGRFSLAGLGRDRAAELRVGGPGRADQFVQVALKPGYQPAVRAVQVAGQAPLSGPGLTVILAPGKPITGTARDKATGQPAARVRVTGWVPNDASGMAVVAVTDSDGRYRLGSLPKAAKRFVLFEPVAAGPLLHSYAAVPDSAGFAPVEVNVELYRGVVVTGRVTDRTTGLPVRADVYYGILVTNEAVKAVPGLALAGGPIGGEESTHAETDADGRYRLTVVSGPGVLSIRAMGAGRRYARPVVATEDRDPAFYRATSDEFMAYGPRHRLDELSAYQVIRPVVGTTDLTADFALVPGVRRTGRLVDADGKPVTGAEAYGLAAGGGPRKLPTLAASEFAVDGVNPDRPHRLLFRHAERKIAGAVALTGADAAPVTVVLGPTATVSGRLVTAAGEPRANVRVTAEYAEASLWELSAIDRYTAAPVRTDAAGRFRIDTVAAELAVMVFAQEESKTGQVITKKMTLKPREARDLGDIQPPAE